MKVFLLSFLALLLLQSCSCTLLTGIILNYLVGSAVSGLRSLVDPSSATNGNSFTRMDLIDSVAKIAKTLDLDRTFAADIEELLSDDTNKVCDNKCKENNKSKKKRKRKKYTTSEQAEDSDIFSDLDLKDSEEYSKYIIRGKYQDPEDIIDKLLLEKDPQSFYYLMKDEREREKSRRKKKKKREKRKQHKQHREMQMQEMSGDDDFSENLFPLRRRYSSLPPPPIPQLPVRSTGRWKKLFRFRNPFSSSVVRLPPSSSF